MENEKRLIYAYKAENAVSAVLRDSTLGPAARGVLVQAIQNIEKVTTVDAVEMVHGEWIYENGEWACSVCKEPALYEVQVYGGGNYKDCDLVRSNYCPNCGAKMDGGNEDG